MAKLQELIAKATDEAVEKALVAEREKQAETVSELVEKQLEERRKKDSKDVVVTTDTKENREKADHEIRAKFFKALASVDQRQIAEYNDLAVKQYESQKKEWRTDAEIKQKAQTVGTSNQGGVLVPTTLSESIIKKLYYVSPVRRLSTVINDMPPILDMPFDSALPTTYWVAEGAAITESGITFAKKTLIPYKLAGLDKFTSEALMDTATVPDLQSTVEDRFVTALALAENAAFVSGDGSSKPFGFRSSDITPTTVTGNTTAGNLAFTDILRLMFGLGTAYRNLGTFITNSSGLLLIWSLKDTQGRPLYLPDITGATPGTFIGKPIEIVDEIPNNLGAGTNESEIWYSVFKNYWIGNRGALRVEYGTDQDDFSRDKLSLRLIERVAGRPFMDLAWTKMNIK